MKPALIFTMGLLAFAAAHAETYSLETQGSEALYRTTLPKAVYHTSRQNDLRDLTVRNASGEAVPHALVDYATLYPTHETQETSQPLPLFPLREQSLDAPGGVKLSLDQGDTHLDLASEHSVAPPRKIYVVDAGKRHKPLPALSVAWRGATDTPIPVNVLASDDLKTWTLIGSDVLLETTRAQGGQLAQRRVQFDSPSQARYYQLQPQPGAPVGLVVTAVHAEYREITPITLKALWQSLPLQQREQTARGDTFQFEAMGHYPARWLQIDLPQNNTIARVAIAARDQPSAPWQAVADVVVYRLTQQGRTLVSPAIGLDGRTARYWRLQFAPEGGAIGTQTPVVSLGWLPEVLVWNARGHAPFTLTTGETNASPALGIEQLMPGYQPEQLPKLPQAAVDASDTAPRQTSWANAPDYKRGLLWGGLLLGVILLAGMVRSLLKSNTAKP